MENAGAVVLVANAAATLLMVGIIWFVQVVHYPLFARVGADGFRQYQNEHMRLTTPVVIGPMLAEAATAVLLLWLRPGGVPLAGGIVGLALLAVVWGLTFWVQVPCHERLAEGGFEAATHARLVGTNWLRTAAWSARAALVLWMLVASLWR